MSETIMAQELFDPVGGFPHNYRWPPHLELLVAESVEGTGGPDAVRRSASQGMGE